MRISRKAVFLIAAALLAAPEAWAQCYSLRGTLEAFPNASASSTNPNASVGLIEGFIDPVTGQTHSVTVIFTPSWAPCGSNQPGTRTAFAWRADLIVHEKWLPQIRNEIEVGPTTADPLRLKGSYLFEMPARIPPLPGGAVAPSPGKDVKTVLVWFAASEAVRIGSSF